MSAKLSCLGLLIAGVLLASASQANAGGYIFTDLGTLGGDNSSASAINDAGQVAGSAWTTGNTYLDSHATLWNGTTATDLGTQQIGYYDQSGSGAFAINNVGQLAGSSGGHAILWNGIMATDLQGTLDGTYSVAAGINDASYSQMLCTAA